MYMRTRYFIAGILLLALFAGCSSDSGEGDAPGGGSGDLYGYVRDASGSAIEGVVVSDGYTCTVTGADGRYAMQRHPNAYYVYYSTPADCKVEVDPSTGLPLFYQKIRKSQPQYDFTLTRQAEETKFRMLAIGDPQVTTTAQVYRFETETVADINSYVAAQTDGLPTYAITLGDIVGNKWELYPDMVKAMARSKTSVPVFQTIGNHDHEFPQVTDLSAQRRYEASFGPVNYSFTRGDVHFVSMDDIIHKATGSDAYTSGFLDWQFEWLKQDLSYVPRTCAVVLCVHIPFRGGFNGAGETYFDEVLELLLGGGAGVRQLLNSGFLWVMGMLLLFVAAVTLLVFALGGADELYCVVDSRGFHVRTALPGANRVKLWMHGKSAALMDTADTNGRVIISEKDLAWKDIARVQLWTDKRLMLLYSPRWWMKLSVPILLAKWNDVLTMVDEKLGKKKAVELPEDWAHQLPPQRVQEKKPRKTVLETDVIPPQTTLPEDEEDYRPLDEVLEELRGK